MQIDVELVEPIPEFDRKPLTRMLVALNENQPEIITQSGVVNLKLIDDESIRALNRDYSGNDYATDVLSFSYIEGGQTATEGELGDMAISLETATRQAGAAGTSVGDEIATLTLHGILHIFGMDHAEDTDRVVMDKLQAELLAASDVEYRNFQWVS